MIFFRNLLKEFEMIAASDEERGKGAGESEQGQLEWGRLIAIMNHFHGLLSPGTLTLNPEIHAFLGDKPPHEFAKVFSRLAPLSADSSFGEIGPGRGADFLHFASFPHDVALAFEADPVMAEALRKKIAAVLGEEQTKTVRVICDDYVSQIKNLIVGEEPAPELFSHLFSFSGVG